MFHRRHFIQQGTAIILGSALLPSCMPGGNNPNFTGNSAAVKDTALAQSIITKGISGPISAQLWSVKDEVEKDLKGTLQQLAGMGYAGIESYPGEKGHYYGFEPKAFKNLLNDMGLQLVSSHVPTGVKNKKPGKWQQANLLNNYNQLVDKAAETGQEFLTCSWIDETLRSDPAFIIDLFNRSAEICKKAGLRFAYHNHDFEFVTYGDSTLFDHLLNNTDADLVKYEMDMFWVVKADHDPAVYFKKYPGRFLLGHVKDMDRQDNLKNTEIGRGSINYVELLTAAKEAGMKHFIVEQETFTHQPLESMRTSAAYLSSLTF